MSLGKRLKEFAENNFSTIADFTQQLGIIRENAYRYFNDTVSPGSDILIRLAELGCDINWLLTGNYSVKKSNYVNIDTIENNNSPKILEYQVFGTIPAGRAEIVDLTDWIQKMVIDYSPQDHALLIVDKEFGYSMSPIIQPGDVALFSFNNKIRNGRPVAARWGESKGALKIAHFNKETPNYIHLFSSNSAEPPIFLHRNKVKLYSIVAFFLLGRDPQ